MVAATNKTENTFTVFRRQVIQTGSYEPAEASCSVTVAVDSESTQEQVASQIAEWGATLEMSNYEALGIGYEITEQGVRRLEKSVPGPTASPPVAAPTARPSSGGSSGGTLDSLWRDLMDNQTDWTQVQNGVKLPINAADVLTGRKLQLKTKLIKVA